MRPVAVLAFVALSATGRADDGPVPNGAAIEGATGQGLAEAPLFAPPAPTEVEDRTLALSSQLRCPVCQGLSVADSPSETARAMLARVRELVAMGYADEQIVAYFVDRYGTWVLLAPPAKEFLPLWMLPVGVVVGGLGTVAWALRRGASGAPGVATPGVATPGVATPGVATPVASANDTANEASATPAAPDPYRERVLSLLDEEA